MTERKVRSLDLADAFEPRYRTPASELAREVLIHGPILRSELSHRLGLSPASLTRLSKPLLDRGLFVEVAERQDGMIGRPAKPLDVSPGSRQFLGVKLTGDAAVAVTTDLRANEERRAEQLLPSHELDDVVAVITALARELANDQAFSAIGISVGGRVSHQRVVDRALFLGWRSVDLASAVELSLGVPVTVENDVVALTAAEHWFGLGRGLSNFAVLTVGAGVGYGLVIHDKVVNTADTGLGLGAHIPLDASGPLCAVGHRGCSTAMLSIPSIRSQVEVGIGSPVTYEEVLQLARDGHPVAREVTRAAGSALGHLIAAVANLAMVEQVVLAGEGIGLLSVARGDVMAGLFADRDRESGAIDLLVDDSGFTSWARGAAAIAIQATLDEMAS